MFHIKESTKEVVHYPAPIEIQGEYLTESEFQDQITTALKNIHVVSDKPVTSTYFDEKFSDAVNAAITQLPGDTKVALADTDCPIQEWLSLSPGACIAMAGRKLYTEARKNEITTVRPSGDRKIKMSAAEDKEIETTQKQIESALLCLAFRLRSGIGVQANPILAYSVLELAMARTGNVLGYYFQAQMHNFACGAVRDKEKALSIHGTYLHRPGDSWHAMQISQCNLGVIGSKFIKKPIAALYQQKYAQMGDVFACFELAAILDTSPTRNSEVVLGLLERAAAGGLTHARTVRYHLLLNPENRMVNAPEPCSNVPSLAVAATEAGALAAPVHTAAADSPAAPYLTASPALSS